MNQSSSLTAAEQAIYLVPPIAYDDERATAILRLTFSRARIIRIRRRSHAPTDRQFLEGSYIDGW